MKTIAGLWIDHRKVVISIVSDEGAETMEIKSNVDKQSGRFEGVHSTIPYEPQLVPADDSREREFINHLNQYYEEVIAAIRDAESILIFGPGEAKGELKRRLEHASSDGTSSPSKRPTRCWITRSRKKSALIFISRIQLNGTKHRQAISNEEDKCHKFPTLSAISQTARW
jgi:hypothetical protein